MNEIELQNSNSQAGVSINQEINQKPLKARLEIGRRVSFSSDEEEGQTEIETLDIFKKIMYEPKFYACLGIFCLVTVILILMFSARNTNNRLD